MAICKDTGYRDARTVPHGALDPAWQKGVDTDGASGHFKTQSTGKTWHIRVSTWAI
jgi:hypothetical protein